MFFPPSFLRCFSTVRRSLEMVAYRRTSPERTPSATATIVSSWWTSRPTYLWIFIVLVLAFGCWIHRHIHADRLHFGGATRVLGDKHTFFAGCRSRSYNV